MDYVVPQIPALPAPPSTASPETFADLADAFLSALPTFRNNLNAVSALISAWVAAAVAGGGAGITAYSSTSQTVGVGSKSWTVPKGKEFVPGQTVAIYNPGGLSMYGTIISYSEDLTASLAVNVSYTEGVGSASGWNIFISPVVDLRIRFMSWIREVTGHFIGMPDAAIDMHLENLFLPAECAFTRASAGYSYTSVGGIELYAANEERYDFDSNTGNCDGLLLESERNNYLDNPGTPATQSKTLAAGTYTCWLDGTGTVTLSGGATGVVSSAESITFTLSTSTSVTFTVAGTVTRMQCENTSYRTSFIGGTTAPINRKADIPVILFSAVRLRRVSGTIFLHAKTARGAGTGNQVLLQIDDGTDNNRIVVLRDQNRYMFFNIYSAGALVLSLNLGVVADAATVRIMVQWQDGAFSASINGGGDVTSVAGGIPTALTHIRIGHNLYGASNWDGTLRQLTAWSLAAINVSPSNMTK